jgi:chromosome segregation ATPase
MEVFVPETDRIATSEHSIPNPQFSHKHQQNDVKLPLDKLNEQEKNKGTEQKLKKKIHHWHNQADHLQQEITQKRQDIVQRRRQIYQLQNQVIRWELQANRLNNQIFQPHDQTDQLRYQIIQLRCQISQLNNEANQLKLKAHYDQKLKIIQLHDEDYKTQIHHELKAYYDQKLKIIQLHDEDYKTQIHRAESLKDPKLLICYLEKQRWKLNGKKWRTHAKIQSLEFDRLQDKK